MKNYKYLLFDLDDTILDFGAAENRALEFVLESQSVDNSPELYDRYKTINQAHWEMLERNELTKERALAKRHEVFFDELGHSVDGALINEMYMAQIAEHGHRMFDGALDVLRILSEAFPLYIITNGVKATQEMRLENAGINPYFQDVFISEDTGFQKPMKEFFEHVAACIDGFTPNDALIIGDSLTSDILGGINSGIDTCWYNPDAKENPFGFKADFEIRQLNELFRILDR
ncbi:YjjG family noncanonical pyrimidine nucleotidase [Salinicoccus carnicancri]|uniref:YjjG family noncanonical pyrimidine nucleotidase n=1 Tax=Salinicoccus carnicancri TaxID=558170 RepID=UPI000309B65B|nr:YjjG family noncanonical pyrimidine nucleotidase [Salinicoccus carnicancri]